MADFQLMYDAIKSTHSELLQAGTLVQEFVSNNQGEIAKLLHNAQRSQDEQTLKSHRSEHAEWFEGLRTKKCVYYECTVIGNGFNRLVEVTC